MKNLNREIFINGRFLLKPPTGVNRFAYELCCALQELHVEFTLLCPHKNIHPAYSLDGFKIVYYGSGKSHIWEQIILPFFFFLRRKKYLLLNFTGLGPLVLKHKIITIHDLAFMHQPAWYAFSYRILYRLLTPLAARTSKKIITVSTFSKKEIMHYLGIPSENIEVIYNALPSVFTSNKLLRKESPVPFPYILAVSSIDPRKNFSRLIEAFKKLENPTHHLCIIGGKDSIFSSFEKDEAFSKKDNVHWLGRLDDQELAHYYQFATCLVYPSLYEGFGIPPLEAMHFNTVSLVSDIPVFREVYQDSVAYTDPFDANKVALDIQNVINDQLLQQQLISKASYCLKNYSWSKSAQKLSSILNDI